MVATSIPSRQHVDVDLVRIGARHVKRMHPAVFAERVLGRPGVELVGRQVILTAKQLKLLRRHDEMKKTLFRADRAVALRHAI